MIKKSKVLKPQIKLEQAVFFERFAQLISAEVPLLRALEIATLSVQDKELQSIFREIKPKLESGQGLTDTFRLYPDYFSNFNLAIIESGEREGHLEDGFLKVAESFREEAESIDIIVLEQGDSIPSQKPVIRSGKTARNGSYSGAVEQLSSVSHQLSVISSHLAHISHQLSRAVKKPKPSKSVSSRKRKRSR